MFTYTLIFNLLFNSMAGYALARIRFPGNRFWFFLVLAVLMVPSQITLIPSFLILRFLGWLDSYQGLVVPSLVNDQIGSFSQESFSELRRDPNNKEVGHCLRMACTRPVTCKP